MCGSTSQQNQIFNEQNGAYQTMLAQGAQVFGNASSVFKAIQNAFAPIVAKGVNQEGFSGAEKTALETQATEGTAREYAKAAKQLGEQTAAAGGGNTFIPSGANTQLQGELAADAAGNISQERNQITEADYEQGRQNFFTASQGLAGADQVFAPATQLEGAAVGAGEGAANTSNQIAQAQNGWETAVGGILGSVAGAASGQVTNKLLNS